MTPSAPMLTCKKPTEFDYRNNFDDKIILFFQYLAMTTSMPSYQPPPQQHYQGYQPHQPHQPHTQYVHPSK